MIDNKDYTIEVIDGIMHYTLKCKILSGNIVLDGIKDRIALSNNQDQYIILDMLSVGLWPASGRNELGKKENQVLIKRVAAIIQSKLISTLLNWFLVFFGIEIPTKIFPNKEAGLAWLTKHREEDLKEAEKKETELSSISEN